MTPGFLKMNWLWKQSTSGPSRPATTSAISGRSANSRDSPSAWQLNTLETRSSGFTAPGDGSVSG
jgi:hypothetical protein